ncbi:phosphoethanolamine transferase [Lelliottia wanjuensis]|uniref:Phosphoethanolamine transferase n=1 Tax=Lelliottia wanjuensis TaxID=3050585 RepID=A0AAP4D341_9ENTR|nr:MULTISPECIES: phosphoethanolamine transferase [unclassified Lelliottia]MDK9364351.1 phosphoethanolamine transferase [Lelliottia sp. V106_12]MDK9619707.1 phosphoethanolamine transferase [Lelliottia sp. V106_9]
MSLAKTSVLILDKKIGSHFLILLLISVLIQIWPVYFTQPARFVVRIAICNSLLLLGASSIYRYIPGKIIAFILTALLTLNFAIAFSTWNVYQSEFNTVFAMSILATHMAEAKSMSGLYISSFPVIAAYFVITWYAIKSLSDNLSDRAKVISIVLLVGYMGWYSTANWLKKRKDLEVYYPLSSRILTNTPFYTGSEFIIAHRDSALANKISQQNVHYPALQYRQTGIENYVVIVGESARSSNMQLYGFDQETTPVASAFKKNALVFTHAIAPASATVLAVPMIMSKADPDNFTVDKLADNIVSIARKSGYYTEWISAQGNSGKSNNYIVAIASTSQKAQWINTQYDTELLPALDEALKKPGKKFIVLHINGSHEMACDRYPESANILDTGNKYEDCYNNAIRFTDYFIGEVAKRLQNSASSMLYFSDHGLEKNPQLDSIYMHGSRNPSKEAYEVPQFIWYSQPALSAQKRQLGWVPGFWPTANNYWLMLSWLGISTGNENCSSVLETCYQEPTLLPVMDGGRHIFDYDQLRETFSSPGKNTPWRKAKTGSL